jgi:twinkle protein
LERHEQVRALDVLDERFRIVHRTYDDDTSHALGWLKSMVHTLAMRDQCKMIIIDPWNEL